MLLARHPGASKAELARLSGLGPQTVSRILADLGRRDLVRRGEAMKGRVGQPAVPFFLHADAAFAIGIEMGWREAHAVLVDLISLAR
jgi:DNA-binding IclR family transcriptional regulator